MGTPASSWSGGPDGRARTTPGLAGPGSRAAGGGKKAMVPALAVLYIKDGVAAVRGGEQRAAHVGQPDLRRGDAEQVGQRAQRQAGGEVKVEALAAQRGKKDRLAHVLRAVGGADCLAEVGAGALKLVAERGERVRAEAGKVVGVDHAHGKGQRRETCGAALGNNALPAHPVAHQLEEAAVRQRAEDRQARKQEKRRERQQHNGKILQAVDPYRPLVGGHPHDSASRPSPCMTGSSSRTVVPGPARSTMESEPLWRWTISDAMDRPRPVPPDSRERALSTR